MRLHLNGDPNRQSWPSPCRACDIRKEYATTERRHALERYRMTRRRFALLSPRYRRQLISTVTRAYAFADAFVHLKSELPARMIARLDDGSTLLYGG